MPASASLQGMNRLQQKIQAMGRKGVLVENKALREGGEIIAESIRGNINRSEKNHPHMKDNIEVSRVKTSGTGHKHVDVGPNKQVAWRMPFLEFGTSKMSAQSPMATGSAESHGEVVAKMKAILRSVLK